MSVNGGVTGTMDQGDDGRRRAERFLEEALREQTAGRYEAAADLYRRSLEAHPTAEAHTFLGWTYSFMGKLEEAIGECRRAIDVDPTFGNPYNDIGSYLMKQGKLDDAIVWLEKAKSAPRYEPRHYPYLNLARLYLAQGRFEEASREFSQAEFLHKELFHKGRTRGSDAGESVN
jgi:Tfp pilus assembly protein PilF